MGSDVYFLVEFEPLPGGTDAVENAGFFAVGNPGEVDLFFSRQIGIGPGGQPIPNLGGGRVSGKGG